MADRAQTILVIEDDPAVGEALVEGIGTEGYDVHWETTGGGGVAFARDHSPQLIVLDVRLPDGNGFDFCRQMRQLGLRQPILMLTVQSDEMDKVLGLEMGADDYLTKPYHLRELIARIRSLLRRAYGELASTEADVLYVGDLTIDRTRATVTRDGRALNLTPTEFRLLVFLAQHPGQVFCRGQLIENVWGSDGDFYDDKTVSVHVRRLREKIEHEPSNPAARPHGARHRLPAGDLRRAVRTRSLRWRLALTYAGMALLTAVILGGILLAVLANYYTRAEDAYLHASAKLVVADPPPLTTVQDLTTWAQAAALTTQTRVQVYAQDGTLVVDSGSPNTLDAETLMRPRRRASGTAAARPRRAAEPARRRPLRHAAATRGPAGRSPWTWATAPT